MVKLAFNIDTIIQLEIILSYNFNIQYTVTPEQFDSYLYKDSPEYFIEMNF
jgi:hypothetical protein